MEKKRGFTLVELLTVIVILAILVLLFLPAVLRIFRNAKIKSFENEVKNIYYQAQKQLINDQLTMNSEGLKIYASDIFVNTEDEGYLELQGGNNIKYCVLVDNSGNIKKLFVSNGTYQYISEDMEELSNAENIVAQDITGEDLIEGKENCVIRANYIVKYIRDEELEEDYHILSYVESTGLEYIDTGVSGNNNDLSFEIKYAWVTLPGSSSYQAIYGSYAGEQYNTTRLIQYGSGKTYYNVNSKADGSASLMLDRTKDTIYEEKIYPDSGYVYYKSNNAETFHYKNRIGTTNSTNIAIFAENVSGAAKGGKKRVYYFKIYDGNSLIRYFIPAYVTRNDTEIVGFFDVVECKFYENIGTGALKKGDDLNETINEKYYTQSFSYGIPQNLKKNLFYKVNSSFVGWNVNQNGTGKMYYDEQSVSTLSQTDGDVIYLYAMWSNNKKTFNFYPNNVDLPNGYYNMEYLSNINSNAGIDTGVNMSNNNLGFELKYSWNELPSEGLYQTVFGAYENENTDTTRLIQRSVDTSYFNINSRAGSSTALNINRELDVIYTESLFPYGDNRFRLISGTNSAIGTRVAGNTLSRNICIFSSCKGNSYANIKLYYFKIYNGNTLIRNYVPCFTIENGQRVGGLYDLVNNTFYKSSTQNNFKGISTSQSIEYSHSEKLMVNTFTKEGYTFDSWNTKPDGTGTKYTNEQLITNSTRKDETIDLYAQWKAN